MGRSFISVRQGVNGIAKRWARAARRVGRAPGGRRLAAGAKEHASEAFCSCETPLEAALFSSLASIVHQAVLQKERGEVYVDP